MPDDLARQIEPLHALVRAHGWPLLMVEGVEADDVIGTLAKQAARRGHRHRHLHRRTRTWRSSCAPRVKIVNTMSNDTYDEAGVLAKFDVRADQVLDLLTLTGDAVDNVPGVAKVGPEDRRQVARAIRHARQRHRQRARDRRRRRQQPARSAGVAAAGQEAPHRAHRLRAADEGRGARASAQRTTRRVHAMYERFEFKQWLKDIDGKADVHRCRGRDRQARARDDARAGAGTRRATRRRSRRRLPPAEIVTTKWCSDEDALARWLDAIDKADVTAFDIEASSLDPMQARIVGISLSVAPGRGALHPARPSLHRRAAAARPRAARSRALRRGSPIRRRRSSATT